ncbi:Uncharacterized protein PHPALM_14216 [Phytophthora palmivora]|uniref:Retroviral polymerase SH3-like domain-containing protein n=1 Tax=Phytophthora palmivora TaxID=4796 RepID=A0A2P4XVA8_9STRA|nr:Uncharacterized protein PHPALM_14216 [Phytophthora palmivora]
MSKVWCALKDADMPERWWPEALVYMAYVLNRTPMSRLVNKTPFEKVYGTTPNVCDLQIWGRVCFSHVAEERRKDKKLSARAVKCRFLGVSDEYKGYRLLDVYNNRFMYSRHVMFDTPEKVVSYLGSSKHQKFGIGYYINSSQIEFCTDLGDISYILKMEIRQNRIETTMSTSQHSYTLELLKQYNAENSSVVATPQVTGLELKPEANMTLNK